MATFYIEAIENTDIALVMVGSPTIGTVKYGVNDSTCPNTYTVTTESTPISLTAGQKCYWTITSTNTNFSTSNYLEFTSTAKINVGGNMSDLIGGDTKIPRNYCFRGLFRDCIHLIDASNLVVVNDFNSKSDCYGYMFQGCTSLTIAPALPATTLTNYCYYHMFYGCTSLTTPPELPATTLAEDCYEGMFQNCTSLTIAPELPATTLAWYCYSSMFNGCTSLTTPPELPANRLATYCYMSMFSGCTSLTIAPELPATTLAGYCYGYMFYNCTSLTTPPTLLATTLVSSCYHSMFNGCTSLTTAPALPATTLRSNCYNRMFYNCTNIKLSETQTPPYSISYRIPSEGTGTEETDSLTDMFASTGGTFRGTPSINTTYYIPKFESNVQLYDGDIKLYPITKTENVSGLNTVVSGAITNQKGVANGIASLGADGKVPNDQLPAMDYIPTSQKGATNGVASLGSDGKIPGGQLPAMNYIPTSQKGVANGIASLDSGGKIPGGQLPAMDYIPISQKGVANGVASLGSDGKVLTSQLPIYNRTV